MSELLVRISSHELSEWAAYEKVYGPLGQGRDDLRTALLATVMHNAWHKKPKRLDDFMPEWDRRPQSPEEMLATVKQINRAYGGTEAT